ncbi:uncharacterized protein BXZ73DRAFT_106288 [Epithele typhae]|uniref:uncharacterized protein n=1 Tax=Epithele typhae TaxID=378194 RepID=UPI002007FAAD|nr:uncharacterized protein BXZ73DRAFT_106288 [Epithele typhae]KAH9915152.1 hypothetical protein BXZ73DRAFT_106288 [Epithele typhae]
MTLNILVSFSLLALVVTARPLNDAPQSVKRSLQVQNAVQALFESRTGRSPDCLACEDNDDVHVSLTTSEEQSALLEDLEALGAVKAVIPLNVDGTPAEDEQQLYEILKAINLGSGLSLEDLDGDTALATQEDAPAEIASEDAVTEERSPSPEESSSDFLDVIFGEMASPPLAVLAVSCFAAFLAVFCVGAGLYAYNHLNKLMNTSDLAWDFLPRLEKQIGLDTTHDDNDNGPDGGVPEKRRLLGDGPLAPMNVFPEKASDDLNEKASEFADAEDHLSDDETDFDDSEKFHDAPEPSLLFAGSDQSPQYQPRPDVPTIVIDEHADPDFLPLPDIESQSTPFATPLRTPAHSPAPQMREMAGSPTMSSKPLCETPMPGALFVDDAPEMTQVQRPRGRPTPRQPIDIAFALQLRPGLGAGADSAWLVRFLMAMFGWMTFFVGAPREQQQRRAIAA